MLAALPDILRVVITVADIAFRYLELAVAASVLLCAGLLFIRRRPAGLVWVSVPAMGALLAHLVLEQGRWQLIPLYVLTFVLAIWLAVPSRRAFGAAGLTLRIIVIVLIVPALLLPVVFPLFVMPAPSGPFGVGSASLTARPEGGSTLGITIRYPLSEAPDGVALREPYWSRAEVDANQLPGLPRIATTHLALVPGPAVLRGRRADGPLPVVIALSAPDSLPSDYLVLLDQIASLGWVVLEFPHSAAADTITAVVSGLEQGVLDSAFTGVLDSDRAVLIELGWDSGVDLGLPTLRVGAGHVLSVMTGSNSYGVGYPDARIPDAALTNRHLLVRPARLLIGGSDVSPPEIQRLLLGSVTALLAGGDLAAPVFAVDPASGGASAARTVVDLFEEATVRPFSTPQP